MMTNYLYLEGEMNKILVTFISMTSNQTFGNSLDLDLEVLLLEDGLHRFS